MISIAMENTKHYIKLDIYFNNIEFIFIFTVSMISNAMGNTKRKYY